MGVLYVDNIDVLSVDTQEKTGLRWNANPEKSRTFHKRLLLHIVKNWFLLHCILHLLEWCMFQLDCIHAVFSACRSSSACFCACDSSLCATAKLQYRRTDIQACAGLVTPLLPLLSFFCFPSLSVHSLSAPFLLSFHSLHRSLFSARVPLLPCCFVPLSRPPDHISRAENMPPLGWSAPVHPYSDPTWT